MSWFNSSVSSNNPQIGRIVKVNIAELNPISVTYEIEFEFDIFQVVSRNVSSVDIAFDNIIDNEELDEITELVSADHNSFTSNAAWINHINFMSRYFSTISSFMNTARSRPNNFTHVTSFNPKNSIDDSIIHKISAELAFNSFNSVISSFGWGRNQNQRSTSYTWTKKILKIKRSESDSAYNIGLPAAKPANILPGADTDILRRQLEKINMPLSEALREFQKINFDSLLAGNIPNNDDSRLPVIDNLFSRSQKSEIKHHSYRLVGAAQKKIRVKKTFKIDTDQYKFSKGYFDLKCIIRYGSSRSSNRSTKVLIKRVNHDKLSSMFNINMPRPRLSTSRPSAYGKNFIEITLRNKHYIDKSGRIQLVAGYNVYRRKLEVKNKSKFRMIDTVRFSNQDIDTSRLIIINESSDTVTNNDKETITYVDGKVNNYEPYEYRFVPINALSTQGFRFSDIITQTVLNENILKEQKSDLDGDVAIILRERTRPRQVVINIKNIDYDATTVEIQKRNLSTKSKFKIIFRDNISYNMTDMVFSDGSELTPGFAYEYIAKFYDKIGNSVYSNISGVIILTSKHQPNQLAVRMEPSTDSSGKTILSISSNRSFSSEKEKTVNMIRNAITSNNLEQTFSDVLGTDEFKENSGLVPFYKIERYNLTTNELEYSSFINGNVYKDTWANVLNGYLYKVQAALVDLNQLIAGVQAASQRSLARQLTGRQTLFRVDQSPRQKIFGTIPPQTLVEPKFDTILESSLDPGVVTYSRMELFGKIEVSSVSAEIVEQDSILITWSVIDDANSIDFFNISRQIDSLEPESLGNSISNKFVDKLNDVTRLCNITYVVTPILINDATGEEGESSPVGPGTEG